MDRDLCGGVGVPIDYQQITVGLLIVNVGATAARTAHSWLSKREAESLGLVGLKRMIEKDKSDIARMIEEANERASRKSSEITTHLGNIDIQLRMMDKDLTVLKTLEGERHSHSRKEDLS